MPSSRRPLQFALKKALICYFQKHFVNFVKTKGHEYRS